MSTYFISIQATHQHAQLALFQDTTCLEVFHDKDRKASSHLINHINALLGNHGITKKDLAFIAADKGPGAFTSLRVTIALLNGIGYTRTTPLIGVDGLAALACQMADSAGQHMPALQSFYSAPLLNAYNGDVYYGLYRVDAHVSFETALTSFLRTSATEVADRSPEAQQQVLPNGCLASTAAIALLKETIQDQPVVINGNGLELHQELIASTFGTQLIVPAEVYQTASAVTIGRLAYQQFLADSTPCYQLEPQYLKSQYFTIKQPPLSNAQ